MADPVVASTCTGTDGMPKALADCADGDSYHVSVSAPFSLVTPLISSLLGSDTLALSASSTAVVLTSFSAPGATPVAIPKLHSSRTAEAADR